MKSKWLLTLFAVVPFTVAMLLLQSCGGEGGPVGGGGGDDGLPPITEQFLALLPAGQAGATYVGTNKCAECHGGGAGTVASKTPSEGENIHADWLLTKHAGENVGCERCHGPGSKHAAGPSDDNILTHAKSTSPIVCAQCHGKIFDEWQLSVHSRIVEVPVEEAAQNPANYGRSSQCIACHSGVTRTFVAKGGNLPDLSDEQIRELSEETISAVPHTASCVTCHDPHKNTANLSANGKEVQLRASTLNTDTTPIAPGTTAASFIKFNHVCGQCHNGRGTSGVDAKLRTSTSRPSMHDSNQFNMLMGIGGSEGDGPVVRNTAHANAPGQCTHCHMADARHSYVVNLEKGCQPCHTAADAAARSATLKTQIVNGLYALRTRMEAWALGKFGDVDMWEYTSNITAEGKTPPPQTDASIPIEIKRARHNYYFVLRDSAYGPHNSKYAQHLLMVANQNLDALGGGTIVARPSNLTTDQKFAILRASAAKARRNEMTVRDGE